MGTIQHWQLITDGLLVLSLLYLAIRFTQSSGAQVQARSQELQKGLRILVKEAERAGHQLNDTLKQRQKELQSLLDEIRASESRAGDIDSKVSTVKQEIDSKLEAAKDVVRNLEETLGMFDSHTGPLETDSAPQHTHGREQTQSQPAAAQQTARPASLSASVERSEYATSPEPPSFSKPRTPVPAAKPQVNIYGEPIGASGSVQQTHSAPRRLEESVEQHRISETPEPEAASMSSIYNAAEQLLKAGYDLQSVAARTHLPLDEVRMLSQIVADEQENAPRIQRAGAAAYAQPAQPTPDDERQSPIFAPDEVTTSREDNRLGVLGAMKRDRYTV